MIKRIISLLLINSFIFGEQFFISDFTGGLNTRVDSLLISNNQTPDCKNIVLDENYTLQNKSGSSLIYTLPCSGSVLSTFEFKQSNGITSYIVQIGSNIYSSEDKLSWTLLVNGQSTEYPCSYLNSGNNLWITNGIDYVKTWNGVTVSTLTFVPKGKYIVSNKNVIFISGCISQDNLVYFSDLYYEPTNSSAWAGSNSLNINGNDGDNITGLSIYNDKLVIFKKKYIYVLYGTTIDDFDLKQKSNVVGCIDSRTIKVYKNLLLFLSLEGLYSFDGATLNLISEKVYNDLKNTNYFEGALNKWNLSNSLDFDKGTYSQTSSTGNYISLQTEQHIWDNETNFNLGTYSNTICSGDVIKLSTQSITSQTEEEIVPSIIITPEGLNNGDVIQNGSNITDGYGSTGGNIILATQWTLWYYNTKNVFDKNFPSYEWLLLYGMLSGCNKVVFNFNLGSTAKNVSRIVFDQQKIEQQWDTKCLAEIYYIDQYDATLRRRFFQNAEYSPYNLLSFFPNSKYRNDINFLYNILYTRAVTFDFIVNNSNFREFVFTNETSVKDGWGYFSEFNPNGQTYNFNGIKTNNISIILNTISEDPYGNSFINFNFNAKKLSSLLKLYITDISVYAYADSTTVVNKTTGTYESNSYDTTFSSPSWGTFDAMVTTTTNNSIAFQVAVSSDNSNWTSYYDVSVGSIMASVPQYRYIKWKATMYNPNGSETPIIYNVKTNAINSWGEYTSQIFNTNSITQWYLFSTDDNKQAQTINYSIRGSSYSAGTNSATWNAIQSGQTITISTANIYIQLKSYLSSNNGTQNPYIKSTTINWFRSTTGTRGTFFDSCVYKNRYYLSLSTGTQTYNQITYIFDNNGAFTKYTGLNIGCFLTTTDGKIFYGDSVLPRLYEMETGTSENGTAINSQWISKDLDFGLPDRDKDLRYITITGKSNNNSTNLGIAYSDSFEEEWEVLTDIKFSNGKYSNVVINIPKNSPRKSYKFKIFSSELDYTYSIKNIGIYYNVLPIKD